MEEKELNEEFLKKKFAEYYARTELFVPQEMEKREFGFGSGTRKIETRHAAFESAGQLKSYLVRNAPLYISYSTAYYEFPAARPMQKKIWSGADLIFDLDAHPTKPCPKPHPEGWSCEHCLGAIKNDALRLLEEFLIPDFGVSKNEVIVNFSGSRGYHVHVLRKEARKMSSEARREVMDYISGTGLHEDSLFRFEAVENPRMKPKLFGPTLKDTGWRGKIAKMVCNEEASSRVLQEVMGSRFKRKQGRISEFVAGVSRGNWDVISLSREEQKKLIGEVVNKARIELGDRTDQNVTIDTSKLIRLPESLHGSTGLIAKRTVNLSSFDPLRDALAFGKQPISININGAPEFQLGGETFGPYGAGKVELPEFAVVFLACKKVLGLLIRTKT
ncbi:MAG: DNA primase catalytic subunit PriS [Candidatus Micrarchaeota archaeon]